MATPWQLARLAQSEPGLKDIPQSIYEDWPLPDSEAGMALFVAKARQAYAAMDPAKEAEQDQKVIDKVMNEYFQGFSK